MIIDHTNALWFDHASFPAFLLGRGAFPLFCYAVAVAVMKSGNLRRYAGKLLVLAVLVQPFYMFAVGTHQGNVIFTLALGGMAAAFSSRLRLWQIYIFYGAAMASMLLPAPFEFGLAGVMLPSAIVLALRGQKSVYPFLLALLFFINAGDMLEPLRHGVNLNVWIVMLMIGVAGTVLPLLVLDVARNFKQEGRFLPKYALHIFYPAHLVILKLFTL